MKYVYLILSSALFAADVGCGYYVRDRISRKRRERYLRAKRYVNIPQSNVEHARRAFLVFETKWQPRPARAAAISVPDSIA
jgi:hypothetical protein